MKKLLVRFSLLALPFVLYAVFFFVFEPYDYFGLKGGAVSEDSMLTRVKSYLSDPADAILLGDSRMAHFDMDTVSELRGEKTANLAFGGASLNEQVDLFWLALEENPNLSTCYFEVSFYNLRQGDERNRTEAIRTVVKNPVAYLFNFNFTADMLEQVMYWLQGVPTGATRDEGHWTEEDYLDENGQPLLFRRNLMEYADTIYAQCENYQVDQENLEKVLEIASVCQENEIELIFVFPPVEESIHQLVIEPLGIRDDLAELKQTLAQTGAAIRDFEYQPEATFTEDEFYDGFHLDVVRGLPEYTELLFG